MALLIRLLQLLVSLRLILEEPIDFDLLQQPRYHLLYSGFKIIQTYKLLPLMEVIPNLRM